MEAVDALPVHLNGKVAVEDFDLMAVEVENGNKQNGREIVLGRNVHTTCLDEFTGDKEAYMASVLARYRKNLMERTQHHLGD